MNQEAADTLFRSVVQNSNDLITVFDTQGNIAFMNDAAVRILGAPASTYFGRNIIDFVHPEEVERAVKTLELSREYGPPPGNTHFRVRRSDDTYVALELTSGAASDGDNDYIMTTGRLADTRFALEQAFQQLVGAASLTDVMSTVCDTFSWHHIGSRIAISWRNPDGRAQWVKTSDLPDALTGAHVESGSPWELARAEMSSVTDLDLSRLSEQQRALAAEAGLAAYWIEPVRSTTDAALITVWTAVGGRPPSVHVQGMDLARSIVEVILRWSDQKWRLDFAAFHDELTRLPNRKAFYRALESSEHGAVLYCDLDKFKPVNDTHGHAAGDEVLRQVAVRLRDCMRDSDVVARIGGDEFAVLCPGSSADDAYLMVDRIRNSIALPIPVNGHDLSVGISVGVAHTTDRLDAESIAAADRALYTMKMARQSRRMQSMDLPPRAN